MYDPERTVTDSDDIGGVEDRLAYAGAAAAQKPYTKPIEVRRVSPWKYLWKHRMFYLLLLPGAIYFLVFKYVPLLGMVVAFQDYNIFRGFLGSEWVGLENFRYIFRLPEFGQAVWNSIVLNVYSLVFGFPAPIIVALLLNEVTRTWFRRVTQSLIYIPHFLSWVVVGGIFLGLLSPGYGVVNHFIQLLGFEPIYFATELEYIRGIIVGSGIWRSVGWGTIIYLAALTTVDPQLYDAAKVDGANRWQQTWHITIPAIIPTATILLLLRIGDLIEYGFEHVFVFLNANVLEKADIIETYVYRSGIVEGQYSLATAVGVFQMVIALLLIVVANGIVRRYSEHSLY